MMTIEQIIKVPANHRVLLDLPVELPTGWAKITITPQIKEPVNTNAYGTVENLRGLAKKMGSTLTGERFLDMKHEDLCLEEENFQKVFQEKGSL
jgi:hypothetical protein